MSKTYKHLTSLDRRLIGRLKKSGKSFRQIAPTLGVAPSTISREFKRGHTGFGYCGHLSHDYARSRRSRANSRRRQLGEPQATV
jgi:IS30 family transposase